MNGPIEIVHIEVDKIFRKIRPEIAQLDINLEEDRAVIAQAISNGFESVVNGAIKLIRANAIVLIDATEFYRSEPIRLQTRNHLRAANIEPQIVIVSADTQTRIARVINRADDGFQPNSAEQIHYLDRNNPTIQGSENWSNIVRLDGNQSAGQVKTAFIREVLSKL